MPDVAAALARVVAQLPGGGEPRPGQLEMAEAVAATVEGQRHLVVQAGTGTGKSLGYLVPCIVTGQRTVIATATKALQDQLAGKDLPFLAEHLAQPFAVAVLKGRSNYLCRQRLAEIFPGGDGAGQQPSLDLDAGAVTGLGQELHLLAAWAAASPTGDRAELDFEPRARAWAQVSVTAVECPGAAKCPKGDVCFAEASRRRAAEADVIVVNTALYGMHLASGGHLLPDHDVVVFDEAHELEDIAATSLGLELSAGRFEGLARVAAGVVAKADQAAIAAVSEVGETVGDLLGRMEGEVIEGGPAGLADASLAAGLALADARVQVLTSALKRAETTDGTEAAARKSRAQQAAGHLRGDLATVAALPPSHVAWVERGAGRQPVLRVAAVDVGAILAEQLWGEVSAILTSATIPPGIVRRLGLPPGRTDELDVGSPFEHRTQGLLYVPKHLPDPRRPGADEAMVEELGWLIGVAGGRTLALFTSFRRMELAAAALTGTLPGPLLRQGDLPKPALVAAFAADESASLFATMGFWQGIDVPGRTLSVVTIDRLPFPRPDEPLWRARRERAGARAFSLVDVPRAATLLAQGAGRLLRTGVDRGVVAVLDPRLATAGYRRDLLAPMPPLKRSVSRDEVAAFLAEVTPPAPATGPDPVAPPAAPGPGQASAPPSSSSSSSISSA
ncbi:MAG: ATP-dependent DNA helicase [Acidimicrobiales bacterium]